MALELVESPVRQSGLIVGQATLEDVQSEPSLRPKRLTEYIGQAKIVRSHLKNSLINFTDGTT